MGTLLIRSSPPSTLSKLPISLPLSRSAPSTYFILLWDERVYPLSVLEVRALSKSARPSGAVVPPFVLDASVNPGPMPTYAVLGATGSAGSAVLRHLLKIQPLQGQQINLYVRSSKKLHAQNPRLSLRPDISIYEATLDQTDVITQAIHQADYIFSCTGDNESPPRLSVALDTANIVASSLRKRRWSREPSKPPTVVVLSSSCLNEILCASKPSPLLWLSESLTHLLTRVVRTLQSQNSLGGPMAYQPIQTYIYPISNSNTRL